MKEHFAGLSFCMHKEQDLFCRISQIFLEFPFLLLYMALNTFNFLKPISNADASLKLSLMSYSIPCGINTTFLPSCSYSDMFV